MWVESMDVKNSCIMSSDEYRRALEEFGLKVRKLSADIQLYEQKVCSFKDFEQLSVWDKVFTEPRRSVATFSTSRRIQPTQLLDGDTESKLHSIDSSEQQRLLHKHTVQYEECSRIF